MRRHRRTTSLLTTATLGALLASGLAVSTAASAASGGEAAVYEVVQEGLVPDQGAELAERAGIGNALLSTGAFSYVDKKSFLSVPDFEVEGDRARDEDGRRIRYRKLATKRLLNTEVISRARALALAESVLPPTPEGLEATPVVDHTTVDRSDRRGKPLSSTPIDTTVTFRYELGGVPVVGPGAKQRIAFDGDGDVIQLSQSLRQLSEAGHVAIISPDEALRECVRMYGKRVEQGEPQLSYYAPPLGAEKASGDGSVRLVTPHYVCDPKDAPADEEVTHTGRLVPAAPELTPQVLLHAEGDGKLVEAKLEVEGGTEPFDVRWSSSSADLRDADGEAVRYGRDPRSSREGERLTVQVTDANGVAATATVHLSGGEGSASRRGVGGLGGAFAEYGIEQTVDEWQCAQDSADGFRSVLDAKGQTRRFDWRGASAWEKDFKRSSLGGIDHDYVDEVDIQWYTGHGWSGGFTFKGNHSDTSIVPSDARWGDEDLEWMNLESCQVLRDTNGSLDYFARWDEVFNGLHLLNGFDTNAYCINGGTGGRFAELLFPETFLWWTTRPAMKVQQAWATMANELEPAGVRWRTISPVDHGVHNLNDHYHGQGSVGPDISPAQRTGFISISGVS